MDQKESIQALSDEYQSLQTELSSLISARQKLESQQQENQSVQDEFKDLEDDTNVYKLVGPVLLKQDPSEAKSTVDGRLEYIAKEIKRIEGSIQDVQKKSDGRRVEILQIQSQMQQASASG